MCVNLCNASHFWTRKKWETNFIYFVVLFILSLLSCISKVHRINGGTRLPPANEVLGLSTLARVEALGPGGCWGLGWGGGGWRRRLVSWGAVARVPGTNEGKWMKRISYCGSAYLITSLVTYWTYKKSLRDVTHFLTLINMIITQ